VHARNGKSGEQWHGDERRTCLMDGEVWVGSVTFGTMAATLESVNEIHAFGLYDKCRTRHREKER
jgi:hypothetical protein